MSVAKELAQGVLENWKIITIEDGLPKGGSCRFCGAIIPENHDYGLEPENYSHTASCVVLVAIAARDQPDEN